jgi:hypothetical protein
VAYVMHVTGLTMTAVLKAIDKESILVCGTAKVLTRRPATITFFFFFFFVIFISFI